MAIISNSRYRQLLSHVAYHLPCSTPSADCTKTKRPTRGVSRAYHLELISSLGKRSFKHMQQTGVRGSIHSWYLVLLPVFFLGVCFLPLSHHGSLVYGDTGMASDWSWVICISDFMTRADILRCRRVIAT